MEAGTIVQAVSVVLAALAIVWHQQRSIDKLRADLQGEIHQVRGEIHQVRGEIHQLRDEIHQVQATVADNGQRLARIEGYLGIGMPSEAASRAAGAGAVPVQNPAAAAR